MKLHERPVDSVRFGGKTYRIDADFRSVMRAMEIMEDKTLWPDIRTEKALRCFIRGRLPHDRAGLLDAIFRALLGEGKAGKRVLSYEQDADMIFAGFWQAYGIDLFRDRLHWWAFRALLANLPENTRMAEVIAIRTRPVPAPNKHNKEQRAALMRAKTAVAIKTDVTPQQSADNLAAVLIAMAEKMR